MSKCESCGGCSGGCGGCSGCGLELELTEEEIGFLHRLGECAFLPVIQEKEAPVFPEEPGKELLLFVHFSASLYCFGVMPVRRRKVSEK